MLYKLVLGAVVVGGLASTAMAADLPSRRAPPVFVPPIVAPAFSWTGFYLGGNAGYAFDSYHTSNVTGDAITQPFLNAGLAPAFGRTRANGFTGGGQIGYNYQIGSVGLPVLGSFGGGGVVIGVEADAAYTDLRSGQSIFTGGGLIDTEVRSRTDFVGTVRGRLGYAFDQFLIYGTGGFAYGGVRDSVNTSVVGIPIYAGARDTIKTGYAYGGGVEYALPVTSFLNVFHSSAVTLKAEFIHYDLGSSNVVLTGAFAGTGAFNDRIRVEGNLVRAGLNFKFGEMSALPVVARY